MPFLKLTGIALIMTSCIGSGLTKARLCRIRISSLEEAKLLLLTLKQRLSFTLATPRELLQELHDSTRFAQCQYLQMTLEYFDKLGFDEAWNYALANSAQAFTKEDTELLGQLTSIIGKSDLATQQQQFDELLHQIDLQIENAQRQNVDKQRMYVSLGTLGGFIAAVLLI